MAEEQKEEPVQPSSSQGGTEGIDPKLAGLLSYLFSIIGGIVFYAISKDKFVRFHAMQSIILGAAYIVLMIVVAFIPVVRYFLWWILPLAFLALTIIMMIKAYQGEKYKLPIIGDIAEKNS